MPEFPDWYTPLQEVWSAAECAKKAKARSSDSYGSLHPWAGEIQSHSTCYPRYGQYVWNGGAVFYGKYYRRGQRIPWPCLAKGYVYISIPSWGVYIRKESEVEPVYSAVIPDTDEPWILVKKSERGDK